MRVVVLGGGVAGSAVALAMAREGHEVRVFERRGGLSEEGGGVVLWPNATRVLSHWGQLERVREAGRTPASLERFDATGNPLGGWDIKLLDDTAGTPSVAILRPRLMQILRTALDTHGVEIEHGRTAVSVARAAPDRGPFVMFDDGERVTADLIVGAEGRMRSTVRHALHPHVIPVDQRFVTWVGTTELALRSPSILDYWGCGLRFGIVPASEREVYWAGSARLAQSQSPARACAPQREVGALFEHFPPLVREVIARAPMHKVRRFHIFDVEPFSPWDGPGLVLVGDAAHASCPTSGQGAAQALEDAFHLARLLRDESELAKALTRFTAHRFEKTRWMILTARAFADKLLSSDPRACARRDAEAKNIPAAAAGLGLARAWLSGFDESPPHSEGDAART